jgi:hypothetical protein
VNGKHVCLILFPREILFRLDRNSYSEVRYPFSRLRNCHSLDPEDFIDALNRSLTTGPHPKPLHSNRKSYGLLRPCCASHVEFLSLRGSASSRVPTPLNSDVTSSLPVVRVTPVTNILHFSLTSSAMWNVARGAKYPSIMTDSEFGHQAFSLSHPVN